MRYISTYEVYNKSTIDKSKIYAYSWFLSRSKDRDRDRDIIFIGTFDPEWTEDGSFFTGYLYPSGAIKKNKIN